jgi:hypothetical protein
LRWRPASPTSKYAAQPAIDLPSLLRLCVELAGRHALHLRDSYAHVVPDGANGLAQPVPTTLPAAIAFVNDAKAKWNAHLSQAGVHVVSDPNKITAPDAGDLQSAMDLANTYRALFNAHIQAAPPGASIQLLEP